MGFMKMGVSLMGTFMLIIVLSSYLNLAPFVCLAVVVWFYGFFHVHSIAGMSDEDFYALEDDYLFHVLNDEKLKKEFTKNYSKIVSVVLIILGVVLIWNGIYSTVMQFLPDDIYWIVRDICSAIPNIVIGIAVIYGGIYLIRGKKKELEQEAWEDKTEEHKAVEGEAEMKGEEQ